MKTNDFLALASNPDFISGIYNYCDRWCERCPMTAKCFLYATTSNEEDDPNATEEDIWDKTFQHIHDSFQITMELLQRSAEENGIDLNAAMEDPDPMIDRQARRDAAKNSPLVRLAFEYLDLSRKWMDNSKGLLELKELDFIEAATLGLPDRNPEREAFELKDALEIINWYKFQIPVKLTRAMTSKDDEVMEDEYGPYPKDSDGSAKVALIGIDRSIGAWGILLNRFPEQEEVMLKILTILDRLRRMTEKEFPKARGFYRDGLDEKKDK